MKYSLSSLFNALLFCIAFNSCKSSKEDILVGKQVWMSENLNVDTFRNGDPIPEAKTDLEWNLAASNQIPAWCYYDNDIENGEKFGKLYNWYAITDPRGIAPDGWRVPTETDWLKLTDYLGGDSIAGKKLKSIDHWTNRENSNPGNGVDEFDFCGLPGGCRGKDRSFSLLGETGAWWSLANYGQDKSGMFFVHNESNSCRVYSADKASGLYLRCIKSAEGANTAVLYQNSDVGLLSANRVKTLITFSKKEHDFGNIKQGDKVECLFKVTNTGNQPLILEEIHGSCGCVTAEFSKEPIPAGESREIIVKFNSDGKKGRQAKTLTITANTEPIQNILTIYADVEI